jgi:hypothetical protein
MHLAGSSTPTNVGLSPEGLIRTFGSHGYHLSQPISPRYMHCMPGTGMHPPVIYPTASSMHGSFSPRNVAVPVQRNTAVATKDKVCLVASLCMDSHFT